MSNIGKYRLYKVLSFLAFALPFAVVVGANFSRFIAFEATKVSLYGYVVLIFMVVAFKNKIFENAKKNPVLTLSIVMFLTAYIMKSFANELMVLSLTGLIGSLLSAVFDPVVEVFFSECFEMNGQNRRRITAETLSHKEGWKRAYR
ncbi:MAG: hypothetical protein RR107_01345 [Clostridia bacterium]